MLGRRRTALRLGSGLLALGLLAGCGSFTSSSTGDEAPAATSGATAGTTAPAPGTPSADAETTAAVTDSVDLTGWLAAVCTASGTLSEESFTADPAAAGSDPAKFAANLVQQFQTLATRLRGFADDLEKIGAPDVPNGKEFTEGYIEAARALADAYDKAFQGLSGKSSPTEVLGAFGKSQSKQLTDTMQKFAKLAELLDTSEIVTAAKSVPECAKVDFSSLS